MKKILLPFIMIILLILLGIMTKGAIDVVNRGSGFLFISSFTPSATNTSTSTNTPTATMTSTNTITPSPTQTFTAEPTDTPLPSATVTPIPTETWTPLPTYDETKLASKIYEEVTASAAAYFLGLTPTATPIIPDQNLYTGLEMKNPVDGKTMIFIKTDDKTDEYGFWIDKNEISNSEYTACIRAGNCSLPESDKGIGIAYFSDELYKNHPVVNVTQKQAAKYCEWKGMSLISPEIWDTANKTYKDNEIIIGRKTSGPESTGRDNMDLIGNVWEWTSEIDISGNGIIAGGSWKTAHQDIIGGRFGSMEPETYAEDVGFRCAEIVKKK